MGDKSGKRSYRLISGAFFPDEAREVLMTLIDEKIKFHQRNNLSSRERFGETDTAGINRIDELRKTRADLSTLIEDFKAAGTKLSISCSINIALAPKS